MDTGRTARTRGQLDLNSVEKKCDTSVRKSRSGIPKARKREKVFLCARTQPLLLLSHAVRMCIHRLLNALAVAPVPPRSLRSVETRRAPVAERVLPAELRGETINPGISLSDQLCGKVFHLLSLILFLDYFQGKKNLEVDFWIEGGEKSRVRLFTTASLCQQYGCRRTQIDLVLHTFKNPNASYVKAVY